MSSCGLQILSLTSFIPPPSNSQNTPDLKRHPKPSHPPTPYFFHLTKTPPKTTKSAPGDCSRRNPPSVELLGLNPNPRPFHGRRRSLRWAAWRMGGTMTSRIRGKRNNPPLIEIRHLKEPWNGRGHNHNCRSWGRFLTMVAKLLSWGW